MENNQHASGPLASLFSALFLGTILTTVVPSKANIMETLEMEIFPLGCAEKQIVMLEKVFWQSQKDPRNGLGLLNYFHLKDSPLLRI